MPAGRWQVARGRRPVPAGRWQVVTVGRPADEVLPGGRLPEPLARLGDGVQVRVRPAPGDQGTELAVRAPDGRFAGLAAHLVGDDPDQVLRAALREVRQLAETGEPLRPDRPRVERFPGRGSRWSGGRAMPG
ncbi:SRPBCC family protein [Micromonospora sagamiensis]|uniref:hypothetical protein n=2 Tax=Micromonospora sagamiensis TaxID=47875 RepID=UPI001E33C25D|nr:hypothetical protein [Micromonospora sagamiensis]